MHFYESPRAGVPRSLHFYGSGALTGQDPLEGGARIHAFLRVPARGGAPIPAFLRGRRTDRPRPSRGGCPDPCIFTSPRARGGPNPCIFASPPRGPAKTVARGVPGSLHFYESPRVGVPRSLHFYESGRVEEPRAIQWIESGSRSAPHLLRRENRRMYHGFGSLLVTERTPRTPQPPPALHP